MCFYIPLCRSLFLSDVVPAPSCLILYACRISSRLRFSRAHHSLHLLPSAPLSTATEGNMWRGFPPSNNGSGPTSACLYPPYQHTVVDPTSPPPPLPLPLPALPTAAVLLMVDVALVCSAVCFASLTLPLKMSRCACCCCRC